MTILAIKNQEQLKNQLFLNKLHFKTSISNRRVIAFQCCTSFWCTRARISMSTPHPLPLKPCFHSLPWCTPWLSQSSQSTGLSHAVRPRSYLLVSALPRLCFYSCPANRLISTISQKAILSLEVSFALLLKVSPSKTLHWRMAFWGDGRDEVIFYTNLYL